jgi:anti-sigma-K factor RskA
MERELEVLIDDYLDGRMSGLDRERFERRMETDPSVRARVVDATRSLELIQQALDWVTPNEEFDSKVTSRISEITSGKLPAVGSADERSLTRDDPEARLLADPAATREKRRLVLIALATAAIFTATVCLLVYLIMHR